MNAGVANYGGTASFFDNNSNWRIGTHKYGDRQMITVVASNG